MRKHFTLSALAALSLAFNLSAAISPASYTLSADGKTITKWSGTETTVDFSTDEVLSKVEAIGNYAFQRATITSLTLNEGLTTIGAGAFMDADLQTVQFPSTLTTLERAAFSSCRDLTAVALPAAVSTIGESCFYNCQKLVSADIENTVITELVARVFSGCPLLTTVKIPAGITAIGEEAFYECESLTSFAIPSEVTFIGSSAFADCISLSAITYSPAITEIESHAFENTAITALNLNDMPQLTSLGVEAFSQNSKLTDLKLHERELSYVSKVFGACTSLKEVTIPDSYSQVWPSMFYNCSALEKVTLGKEVATIKSSAFFSCSSLREIVWNDALDHIEWNVFFECNSLRSLEFPESLTSIDQMAFCYMDNLESVKLGSRITSLGQECFSQLPSLKTFEISTVTPPVLGSFCFYGNDLANVKLLVPAESIEAYSTADQWKDFGAVEDMAGINATTAIGSKLSVGTSQGLVTVSGLNGGEQIALHSIDGRTVARINAPAGNCNISAASGLYVITVDGAATKVVVR